MAEVATTSTARRRATNTTNSYKNCELFTGIVVVVVLAYFALDSAESVLFPFPVVVAVVIAALHFRFRNSKAQAASETVKQTDGRQRRRVVCCQCQLRRQRRRRRQRRQSVALVRSCAFCISLTLNQYFLPESFAD